MVKTPAQQKPLPPPLENGDRLNRLNLSGATTPCPSSKKAELIAGVVYMGAALRFRSHGQPDGRLITWRRLRQCNIRRSLGR